MKNNIKMKKERVYVMNKLDCAAAKKSFLEYSPPPCHPFVPPHLQKKFGHWFLSYF